MQTDRQTDRSAGRKTDPQCMHLQYTVNPKYSFIPIPRFKKRRRQKEVSLYID